MTVVTILSLVSFSDPNIPKVKIPGLDKVVHFTFYCVATILGCFFARERSSGNRSLKIVVLTFSIVTVIYGIVIEVLQHQMQGTRDGNIYDAIANISGTCVGVFFVLWLFSKKGLLQWKV